MIKTIGRWALRPFLGKARLQGIWESLYEVSLAGLNFGEGNHPKLSGERRVMDLIRQKSAESGRRAVLFDVGANIGVYTRELLEVFDGSAEIWAFEPSEATFRALTEEVRGCDNVHLRNIGFGDSDSTATLYSPGDGSKLSSIYDMTPRFARLGMSHPVAERVNLTTIDSFLSDEGIEWVDFLKLDVEGHELKILDGARDALANGRIRAIQFEFSAANVYSRVFFRDFYDRLVPRYALYRVLQDGLRAIIEYKETYEIFKRATNYLALLRESSG
jgi:FkbM family methyltransferase